MFQKVLILSASAGAGHTRAAQALERAFLQQRAAREVRHVDTLQFTNAAFRQVYSKAFLQVVKAAPDLWHWLYQKTDRPYRDQRLTRLLNRLNTGPFRRLLEDEQPDLAVCTHFLPAAIISRLKEKERLTCPLAVVVTDFDVHGAWLCPQADRYFVALEEARVYLAALGVPAERISVTGIPIDPVFAQPQDPAALRRKFGLDARLTTILLSAGGFGVGPIEDLFAALRQVRHPAQIVVICGKNAALKRRLETLAAQAGPESAKVRITAANTPPPPVHCVGYTTEMDQYMAAADLLVGKPGGLTTSEALARGLPMMIVNPIPGQEERNSDHLLEQGAALRCNNLPVLAWKLDGLLGDPARLAGLRRSALRLAKPHAAEDIVRELLAEPGATV